MGPKNDPTPSAEEILALLLESTPNPSVQELESLRVQYPERAEELRDLLASRQSSAPSFPPVPDHLGMDLGDDKADPQSAFRVQEGAKLGDYRLLRFIARGGMGEVWEAEQLSLSRRVALKLILPGQVNEQGLALFAREARAGGRLHHPGIVAVYGFGEDEGLYWIAMELVEGGDDLKARLEDLRSADEAPGGGHHDEIAGLCAQLADALEHAHQANVIHRDLKPRNVLMAQDGRVKLTDFGLAKIMDEAALSRTGDFAGTYFYMSPEQVAARRMGLDHRSDIFSLGVLLYEMLSLRRPFEGDTVQQVVMQIVMTDPPDLRSIRSRIPADLAVICGKCLEKSKDKRYSTAAEVASDLRRYLANEPIVARPPTATQRVTKWTRRNPTKSSVIGVAAAALVVIAFLFNEVLLRSSELETANTNLEEESALLDAVNANLAERGSELEVANLGIAQERDRTDALNSDLERRTGELEVANVRLAEERDRADEEARLARGVADFMMNMFELASPNSARRPDVTALEVLEVAAAEIRQNFRGSERIRGELLGYLGHTFNSLARPYLAAELMEEALEISSFEVGEDHTFSLWMRVELEMIRSQTGEVEASIKELYHLVSELDRVQGAHHENTVRTRVHLADTLIAVGRPEEAEVVAASAIEGAQAAAVLNPATPMRVRTVLGRAVQHQGRLEDAREILFEAYEEGERLGLLATEEGLILVNNLGGLCMHMGDLERALELLQQGLADTRAVWGDDHPDTLLTLDNLAGCMMRAGDHASAEPLLREAAAGFLAARGPDHSDTIICDANLANCLMAMGQVEDAFDLFTGLVERAARANEIGVYLLPGLRMSLAECLLRLDRHEEAVAELRGLCTDLEARSGEDHYDTLRGRCRLGVALVLGGTVEEGIAELRSAGPRLEEYVGLESSEAVSARLRIIQGLQYLGQVDEASAEAERLRGELPQNSYMRQLILDELTSFGL